MNDLFNGIITGCISTVLFNPVDRALYLTVKNNTPIYHKSCWKNPYSGMHQALYSRIIGYGLYYPINDLFKNIYPNNLFASSLCTGFTTTLLNHPINIIKMSNWNNNLISSGLFSLGCQLKNKYGLPIFIKGLQYTLARDVIFSCLFFNFLKTKQFSENNFVNGTTGAMIAAIITSPINYYRNATFFDLSQTKNFTIITKELYLEIHGKQQNSSSLKKIYHLFHNKFNVGYGTLRVSIGMSFSKLLYDYLNGN